MDEITRTVLLLASDAYFRALHAQERIRLIGTTQELAANVHSVADRRYKAGDIAVLDVNIARASLARVRAEREAAEAMRTLAVSDLRQLLRIDSDIHVEGKLAIRNQPELAPLLQSAMQRPELRALEAGVQEAEAEAQVGRTFARPEYGLGVRYAREEGDQIILGGVTLRCRFSRRDRTFRPWERREPPGSVPNSKLHEPGSKCGQLSTRITVD